MARAYSKNCGGQQSGIDRTPVEQFAVETGMSLALAKKLIQSSEPETDVTLREMRAWIDGKINRYVRKIKRLERDLRCATGQQAGICVEEVWYTVPDVMTITGCSESTARQRLKAVLRPVRVCNGQEIINQE